MRTDMNPLVPFKVVLSCRFAKDEVYQLQVRLTLDVIAQGITK
jgi:hypothetical protein